MAEPNNDLETSLLIGEESDNPQTLQRKPTRRRRLLKSEKSVGSGNWKFRHDMLLAKLQDSAKTHDSPKTHGAREYYRKQRETLAGFQEVDAIVAIDPNSKDVPSSSQQEPGTELAITLSNFFNVFLLIVKVYASWKSGSLAIVASTLDSLLDLLVGLVLWLAHVYMMKKDQDKYPIGKLRIQPVGIVVFAVTMATLGLQVLITGVQQLMEADARSMSTGQRIWTISIMGTATVVKLGLFLFCTSFKDEIVKVYAKDHFFDVITNIVGLAAALLADYFYWWIDPIGAILLALYTITNWGKVVLETAGSLVGQAAPPILLQKLTYMAMNHHIHVQRIDTVRAYTFGSLYFVEVDIQLPENMTLKEAHEIGESLQNKIEALPEVERAFVHLDYECSHRPEHFASAFKY